MKRVVGGASRGEQPDASVDDGFLIDAQSERPIVSPDADLAQPVRRRAGESGAQLGAGIDESAAGDVESHHLHHHLVAVRGAKEGAGSRPVVRRRFGFEQFLAPDFALRIQLPDALLFLVGEARGHRTSGNKDHRQMAEAQATYQQPWNDLVAYPEQKRAFKHRMAERNCRCHRNHIAAEQR